jgi:DNA-binding transcriptional ArsR family regulator
MNKSGIQLRAKLFRGLGDASRLGVLEALRDGPLSAGEVVARTGLSQPNTSMHLACLAECGLVTWRREGKFVYYQIADKRAVKLLDQAEELLLEVAPLIEACPRYRQPERARAAQMVRRRRR